MTGYELINRYDPDDYYYYYSDEENHWVKYDESDGEYYQINGWDLDFYGIIKTELAAALIENMITNRKYLYNYKGHTFLKVVGSHTLSIHSGENY